ncbi:MAG: hypothetical protein JWN01_1147 [Patescibacteria group bacterium]|nr:hypothetical protein [Patescibacteria group bacterium]
MANRHLWLVGIFVALILTVPALNAHAATLSSASLSVSDPRPSALSSNYTFTGSSVTTGVPGTIKCIKIVYADTASGSTVPSGMSTNGGGVTLDTTNSNYMPTPASWTLNKPANGTLTLTNAAGEIPASAAARKVVINGITNSSTADTRFFMRINTYNNTDCSSSPVDSASVTFILTNASTLTLTVDDTLSFTINAVGAGQGCDGTTTTAASTATTIPFGTVSAASNAIVCQDLQAATNATNGYTIYARYTAQPANALAQTIANHTGTNTTPTAFSAAGTESYGYTTNDTTLGTGTANRFTSPAQEWASMATTNAELAYESAGVNSTTYRVGHQVGVSSTTKPGTYTTTVVYTCTPVY